MDMRTVSDADLMRHLQRLAAVAQMHNKPKSIYGALLLKALDAESQQMIKDENLRGPLATVATADPRTPVLQTWVARRSPARPGPAADCP